MQTPAEPRRINAMLEGSGTARSGGGPPPIGGPGEGVPGGWVGGIGGGINCPPTQLMFIFRFWSSTKIAPKVGW
jgi:hypothetical protein